MISDLVKMSDRTQTIKKIFDKRDTLKKKQKPLLFERYQ